MDESMERYVKNKIKDVGDLNLDWSTPQFGNILNQNISTNNEFFDQLNNQKNSNWIATGESKNQVLQEQIWKEDKHLFTKVKKLFLLMRYGVSKLGTISQKIAKCGKIEGSCNLKICFR